MKRSVVLPFVALLLLLGISGLAAETAQPTAAAAGSPVHPVPVAVPQADGASRDAAATATVVGSSDVCTSWTEIPLPPGFKNLADKTSFEIWADASRFLVLADGDLYLSDDNGVTWTEIDTGSGRNGATHFNVDGERLLYSRGGDVYRRDGNWTSGAAVDLITLPTADVTQICSHGDFIIVPGSHQTVLAEAKTYYSRDDGATWWNLYGTQPGYRCAIHPNSLEAQVAVKADPDFANVTKLIDKLDRWEQLFLVPILRNYVAVDGIVVSADGGETWETINFATKPLDLLILPEVSYAIKEDGSGLYTTGNKWFSYARLESSVGGLPEGLNAVVGSGATAFVSSRDVSFGGILTTPDKGVTWNKLTGPVTTDTDIWTTALYFDQSSTKLHSMWYSETTLTWHFFTGVCEVNAS